MRTRFQLAFLGTLLLAGCKDEGTSQSGPPAGPVFSPPKIVLPSGLPSGWRAGPASSIRSASFVLEGEAGTVADVSLMILPGQPGGMLRNGNSWRKQLGHSALDQDTFEQESQWLTTPVGEGVIVDISASAAEAHSAFDGRLVAVVIEQPNLTWFFKMRGNAKLVEAEKEAFLDWVASVKMDGQAISATEVPPEPAPSVPARQPDAGQKPAWEIPESWSETPAGPGHFATFSVPDPNRRTGEASVVLLEGDGGGSLANVNRWRLQAGLPPLAEEKLAGRVQSVFSNGSRFSLIKLAGRSGSTIAAWTTRPEGTWIIKLTGPTSVTNDNRAQFAAFLQSIRFPSN